MSTIDKPSQNEDEYFAKRDAELIAKRREAQQKAVVEAERKSHFMKCPKCGADLETFLMHHVHIDRCPECKGVWLDDGELEQLLKHGDSGFFGRVFGDLFASMKK